MQGKKDVLTWDFAKKRKEQIGEIKYDLFLDIESKAKEFKGKCKITFDLNKIEDGIVLESVSEIKNLLVNGKKVKYGKDDFTITLNEGLKEGEENIVEIDYIGKYVHNGDGFHQFVDPEDEREYIYCSFEPYDAHRLLPCFDQPDLKAKFKLSASVPKDWVVISHEEGEEKIKGEKKIMSFEETKKLSTYLLNISLGNYAHFEDSSGEVPMKVYFRKSLEKYIPHEEMFKVTKESLKFYEDFFDYKYPFSKYDQIFVPELNAGAMENPGVITFSEHLIHRRKMTRTERSLLANTLTHEMAHMWFGDLVTMKWWNDLWLNESFADFMCYFVMSRATEFKDAWEEFYRRKAWAYLQDQYPTTHPIETSAKDTDIAFSNFDGISYSKGASVLKQLMFYIGEDSFREGVREYFKKYQWQNTELKDFKECLENASKMDLTEWFDEWIRTTGINTIKPKASYENNKIKKIEIIQEPSKNNNFLRRHKTKVALFYNKEVVDEEVMYEGKETEIKDFSGKEKPNFVFLNYHDYDYVKERFDEDSMKYLLNNLDKIKDDLTSQMAYGSLWQMDAEFNPKEFLDIIFKNVAQERNLLSLERMLGKAKSIIEVFSSDALFKEYSEKFFDLSLEMLNSDIGMELKNTWFGMFVSTSLGVGKKKAEKLLEILNEKLKFENLEIDQDKRWSIIIRLEVLEFENADELLEKEKKKDKSDIGVKKAAIAEASKIENKEKFWKLYLSGEGKSLDYIMDAMAGFFWKTQKGELKKYVDLFFDEIINVFENHDKRYSNGFFGNLFPMLYPDNETLEKAKKTLERIPKSEKLLIKDMKEGIDDLERVIRVLEKYG